MRRISHRSRFLYFLADFRHENKESGERGGVVRRRWSAAQPGAESQSREANPVLRPVRSEGETERKTAVV